MPESKGTRERDNSGHIDGGCSKQDLKMRLRILLFIQRARQAIGAGIPIKEVIDKISVLKTLFGCSIKNELRGWIQENSWKEH